MKTQKKETQLVEIDFSNDDLMTLRRKSESMCELLITLRSQLNDTSFAGDSSIISSIDKILSEL